MTTDLKERLSFAAKAAGISEDTLNNIFFVWRPDLDDGDSRRLAVALRMDTWFAKDMDYEVACAETAYHQSTIHFTTDPCAAMREAVLSVAEQVGRSMTKQGD